MKMGHYVRACPVAKDQKAITRNRNASLPFREERSGAPLPTSQSTDVASQSHLQEIAALKQQLQEAYCQGMERGMQQAHLQGSAGPSSTSAPQSQQRGRVQNGAYQRGNQSGN